MRISVVIPAFKAAATLAEAIESALAQTEPAHEVLVVDDASPDDQATIAARYPVQYVRLDVNGGEAEAKNAGARAATGDFVATLDADDVWEPARLAEISALLAREPDLDIVTTDATVELDGQPLRRYYGGPTGAVWAETDQRRQILERSFIFSHAAVRRSRWLEAGGLRQHGRDHAADWPFWVRLLYSGSRAGLVDEPLVRYRLVSGSISDSASSLQRTRAHAMRAVLEAGSATPEEQAVAAMHLADAERQLARLAALSAVYEGRPARLPLVKVIADSGFRRRERAEALVAAIAPRTARGRMVGHPDQPTRN